MVEEMYTIISIIELTMVEDKMVEELYTIISIIVPHPYEPRP